ncbi:MAG TPA: ectoine hydroxylase, partial [Planctomycetaceae bacterium]|nr:ectoine hydroxylase [Planctomycetaceae bacterium]
MTANTTTDSTTRVEDLYPSRVKQQPEFLERRDPVVYGDAQNGPLNAEQLEQFDRDGFLLLPGFYTNQQVSLCHQELDRLRDSEQIRQRPEAIVEPDGSALRSLFAVHRPEISTRFSQVAADKRILEMVMQVLGSEVYIHQSRVNLKPGFAGKEFFWHSDFETWHVEDGLPRMRTVSCSLLLDDNHEFNAPLMLLPGSHRQYVTCVGQAPENHYQSSLKQQKYGVPDPESLTQLVQEYGITQAAGPAG